MYFIVGINLAVIALGIIASYWFSSLAEEKGYPGKRAKRYPYVVAAGALFIMMFGQTAISFAANVLQSKSGTPDIILYCWSGFVMLLFWTVLKRAYKNMQAAPDAGASTPTEET